MPLYNETVDDLTRKYGHTFVYINGALAYVRGFNHEENSDRIIILYMLVMEPKAQYKSTLYDNVELKDLVIENQFYNVWSKEAVADQAYVAKRRPMRQYRRGVCHDNMELSSITNTISLALGIYNYSTPTCDNIDNMKSLVNPWYPVSVTEAMEITARCGSVALCPEFGLIASPFTPDTNIFYLVNKQNHIIGALSEGVLKIGFIPFMQEVQDCSKKYSWNVTIEGDGNR